MNTPNISHNIVLVGASFKEYEFIKDMLAKVEAEQNIDFLDPLISYVSRVYYQHLKENGQSDLWLRSIELRVKLIDHLKKSVTDYEQYLKSLLK